MTSVLVTGAAILAGRPTPVFNRGEMERAFTYEEDIVDGLARFVEWYRSYHGEPELGGSARCGP